MNTKKEIPQPTSLTTIADKRAWHIIDRLDTTHFFGEDRRKIINQFSACLRLLESGRQDTLCSFAARAVIRSGRYWNPDDSHFANMFGDLSWNLNPTEVRSLTPREMRRLGI